MAERFFVLRGGHDGPRYLRAPEGEADWIRNRARAHAFDARRDAARAQEEIVARDGVAAAVVPV